MKTLRINLLISCVLAACFFSPPMATAQPPSRTFYVLAPSGLVLRAGTSTATERVATIPYGAAVEVLAWPTQLTMTVDQLPGGMAQIRYQNMSGYAFSGFLSQFLAPQPQQEPREYAVALRQHFDVILLEEINRDWGGYLQSETAVYLPRATFAEAFLVAKQLFGIPPKLNFPVASRTREVKVDNPEKPDYAWEDSLMVLCTPDGKMESITYYFRTEGGGRSVIVVYDPEKEAMRISELQIAD